MYAHALGGCAYHAVEFLYSLGYFHLFWWAEHVPVVNNAAGSMVTSDGKTFKALNGWGNQFDYAAFAFGDNEISKTVCSMATVALNAAKSYYE